jgi:hypothetical protein
MKATELIDTAGYDFWAESCEDEVEPFPQCFRRATPSWPVLKSTTSSFSDVVRVQADQPSLTAVASQERPCDKILSLTGEAVLVPIPTREKGPRIKGWQSITLEEMTPRYLSQLDANIGVVLGKASKGLCTIDCDGDEIFAQLLEVNPHLTETLHSHGARGGNVWIRIEGEFPASGKIRDQHGGELGEWRADGNQTVIHGIHPSGINYTRNEKSVLTVPYHDINWPTGWVIGGKNSKAEKKVQTRQPSIQTTSWNHQINLVSPEKVEATLFKIPTRPDRDMWLRISAAVRNSLGDDEKAIELLKRWSPEEQEGEYSELLSSSKFSEISFGTLAHYAQEFGGVVATKEEVADDNSPLFTDLSAYLDGTAQQEVPSVAASCDGKFLFYAGRLNEIHAEPGVGKTNVLMAASIAVLNSGGSVLYIDPEDTPQGFATRMLMLGADPEDIRARVFYLHNPEPKHILKAQDWARTNQPQIVILDGLAESMAAVAADENSATEVLQFFRDNLRPFAEAGAAVVIADHVTKNAEGRGQFARGSGAKAGRYDGVSYEIQSAIHYTPTQAGFVKLKIAKDRNGGAGPRGRIVAELHFMPGADGHTVTTFRQPEQTEGPFRPTTIMERIRQHVEAAGEATTSELRSIGGKTEYINRAIQCLKDDGVIGVRRDGNRTLHFLLPVSGSDGVVPCS